jgi:DNA-binding response OmpR family regulator
VTDPEAPSSDTRPVWIALATDGPMLAIPGQTGACPTRVVPDEATFLALLDQARPRIAIVSEPPASPSLLDYLTNERHRRPRLRVVHLAPDDAVEARLDALRRGFDEALPSTIEPHELNGRLLLLDERTHPKPGTSLSIGDDLELDLVAHELRRLGQPVHLRPKEFALLSMLAAHPGRAYTRRQLLDRVWGHDHDGDPRTVDVHIRWLRSKIEADPSRPVFLVTLRGIGYRLDGADEFTKR